MIEEAQLDSLVTRGLKILLIEDDEEDRFLIERILRRSTGDRHSIDWISSSTELSDRLREVQYDAILLDYYLGTKTAEDLVAELTAQSESTAIIVLTGKDASGADEAAFGMAIDFFLSKSDLSPGGIDRAIRYAIRNRDQQVRLRNFSRLVAHDLMGPVGNVKSAAETLSLVLPSLEGDSKELLDVLCSDCENLMSTLSALHDFSMSQAGQLSVEACSLEGILESALSNLNMADVITDGRVFSDSLPQVSVDPKLFTHVFQNLIQNALKYNASKEPRLRISATIGSTGCELRFSDNGIGIAPSKISAVFRPMYRLHGASEYKGTGLGLAVCKEVVERHGGRIWAESSGVEGEGSTFIIRLAGTSAT
ncbi:ATP-binding protein [Pelagicoccus sp. SDUM812002]|uniref:sensor histidine kinase n=1 Tax=Pelagicoccus sp. SDUM812002 TaxID=3041266 RepID=UPI00280FEAA7|nr:ATP-binding protein [Pelagicoccus sp. SDUM812002]MDQ8187599.1 ATP-binding protein [Pelagicoccus sp. SDUM812002]